MMSASSITPVDWLTASQACEELFLDFHRHIDGGNATRAVELFGADPVFEVRGERHQGREAILSFLAARESAVGRQTRHLASNFRFTLDSPTRARATANLTLFHATGGERALLELEAVVDCELTFAQDETKAWRMISRRHSRFASTAA